MPAPSPGPVKPAVRTGDIGEGEKWAAHTVDQDGRREQG